MSTGAATSTYSAVVNADRVGSRWCPAHSSRWAAVKQTSAVSSPVCGVDGDDIERDI